MRMTSIARLLIASSAPAKTAFRELLPWLLLLLAAAVVGAIVVIVLRRWLRAPDSASGEGFTLHDLRRLHAAGQLNDDEFQRAKSALIDRVRAPTSENAPTSAAGNKKDRGDCRGGPV
jgi:hypothetical protein